jgi:hypothetical protein
MTANSIVTPQTPISYAAVATVAETAFSAPTNAVTVIPPTDNIRGMRLTKVYSINRGARGGATTVAWYKLVGSTYTLIDAVIAADNTPSSSVAPVKADMGISDDNPMTLQPGEGLAFSTGRAVTNGETGRAEGGQY